MMQDRRIRRKTDKRILAVLCWIYFLQIFDKVVFGLGNVFGLSEDLKLTGAQYRSVSLFSTRTFADDTVLPGQSMLSLNSLGSHSHPTSLSGSPRGH